MRTPMLKLLALTAALGGCGSILRAEETTRTLINQSTTRFNIFPIQQSEYAQWLEVGTGKAQLNLRSSDQSSICLEPGETLTFTLKGNPPGAMLQAAFTVEVLDQAEGAQPAGKAENQGKILYSTETLPSKATRTGLFFHPFGKFPQWGTQSEGDVVIIYTIGGKKPSECCTLL